MREAKFVLSHKPHKKRVNTSLKLNICCMTPKPKPKTKEALIKGAINEQNK